MKRLIVLLAITLNSYVFTSYAYKITELSPDRWHEYRDLRLQHT